MFTPVHLVLGPTHIEQRAGSIRNSAFRASRLRHDRSQGQVRTAIEGNWVAETFAVAGSTLGLAV